MEREEIRKMMNKENLGFACVFKRGDRGFHTDFLFQMTPENIANFIGQNAFNADKIIMTDLADNLICESIYGGFLTNCPDQNFCGEIISYLAPIQQGEKNPEAFFAVARNALDLMWEVGGADEIETEMRML